MPLNGNKKWTLYPLRGSSGEAFMGVNDDERVFFKRNTSPFISTLSAIGLVPQLKWTQRTYSGEVLTAQEWIDGQLLQPSQMEKHEVTQIIKFYQDNQFLLEMLSQVGGSTKRPVDYIDEYFYDLPQALANHQLFEAVITYLEQSIDDSFYDVEYTVCHGDLNHNNFILTPQEELFLVDWESVCISDPLSDLTMLLCQYFSPSRWYSWFKSFGYETTDFTPRFYKRVEWYSLMNCLLLIKDYFLSNRSHKMNETILLLRAIYQSSQDKHNKKARR